MKLQILLAFIFPALCFARETVRPFTTLRPAGNQEVVARYQTYLDSKQSCAPVNNGPRVILSGFGIWNNTSLSYSGYLIDNLASQAFWPESDVKPNPVGNYVAKNGVLHNEGTRIVNRSFLLKDGREISACLILVDVLWDFAGAVVATEMERFQPQAVIMMGVGPKATIEGGATNTAYPMAGYIDGLTDGLNFPLSKGILPNFPAGSTIAMTWDVARVTEAVQKFEPHVTVHHSADPQNDYICNNISYIALQAAAGETLRLAEGLLTLKPVIQSRPQVGFYHLNSSTSGDLLTLKKYAEMVLAIAETAIAAD